MARPTFGEPAILAKSVPQSKPSKPKLDTSIKLDNNNADEDDLKGLRESLSRDPVDVPRAKPKPKKQGVNEFQLEHDKETKTPPTEKEDAFKKPLASPKEIQNLTKKEIVMQKQKDKTKETKEHKKSKLREKNNWSVPNRHQEQNQKTEVSKKIVNFVNKIQSAKIVGKNAASKKRSDKRVGSHSREFRNMTPIAVFILNKPEIISIRLNIRNKLTI